MITGVKEISREMAVIMRIVFITPAPFLRRMPVYRMGGKLYGQSNSITGPLILGGILKRAGHDVEVYEELNGKADYKKLIPETDVFCFTIMTSTAPRAYELADRIHREGHARVLIGGIHATALPEEALQHADQVMTGEGEKVILDVVEGRLTDKIVKGIPIENLDDVPFPDYSILKTPCQSANILTTRGCPFRCTFCTTSRMFAPYRQRSVENVLEEIRLYKRMGFRYMNFEDDNFTADKERAKEICRRMIAEHLQFKETFFFGRTDMANDEELLDLLQQAHLTRVLIGIESLNQKALDSINKHQNIQDIMRAGAACRDHGIRLIASIVLGIDEDRREDIRRSVDFAKSIDAYQLQPAILTPYPQTPVYEQFVKEGRILTKDWSQFDMMNVTFQPKNLSPWDLQEEFYHAASHFYDFRSALRIGKLFGGEYGRRRMGLAFVARLGPLAARIAAKHAKGSYYYQLKHTPWRYAPAEHPADPTEPQRARG
jgi:radical SAM superfamily enzyme YgiQ (UPF0313 family)